MKTWQVEYNAIYWVKAETEEEAIDLGIQQHFELPDGDWSAFIDPMDPRNFKTEQCKHHQ